MNPFFLLEIPDLLGSATTGLATETAGNIASDATAQLINNPTLLLAAIVLIGAAILIIFFVKKIFVNSILGIIAWAIVYFIFNIKLPLAASLVVSVIFGLAGIGAMLILKFLGVI